MLAECCINSKSRESFKNITPDVESKIIDELIKGASPDVISNHLKMKDGTQVSKNTIYRQINADRANDAKLYAYLPHAGKPYRAKSDASDSKIPGRIGIEHRPAIADAPLTMVSSSLVMLKSLKLPAEILILQILTAHGSEA